MQELISIIINVYNGEKFIKKCIDCIINQTYRNLEILIINDGSTDNTLNICESYDDKRIRIITTENLGLSLSRNLGIDNAKGEYLYFIDVDDLIELDTIEYLYNLCKRYNLDFSTCRSYDVRDFDYSIDNKKEKIEIISNICMLKKIFLAEDNAVALWNKLIRKSLFNNLRFEERIINDIVFTYRIVLKTDRIAYSNQYKYFYLKHSESICSRKKEDYDRSVDMYNAFIERHNYVKRLYPDLIENNVSILYVIERLYLLNNIKILKYLEEQNAIDLYKKNFSLKILKCDFSFREKMKYILFRISPKLHNHIIRGYLKVKRIFI